MQQARASQRRTLWREKPRRFALLASAGWPALALSWQPGEACAAEAHVSVTCPDWAPEAAAQVEARIRTSLLLQDRGVLSVKVSCQADTASVEIDAERGQLTVPVTRKRVGLEDDVVETVERALEELHISAPTPSPTPAEQPPPPPPAPPAPEPARPPRPAAPAELRRSGRRERVVQVEARALGELWARHFAGGGEAGVVYGDTTLQYGLALAGRVAAGEPSSFEVDEWSAAARAQLTLRHALGVRISASLGISAFVVTPATEVTANSPTLVAAAFLELGVSRPIWLGNFGITPALGGRLFGGSRNVLVQAREELRLPLLAPQASLALIGRFPL